MIEDGRAPAREYGSALERYAAAARGGVAEAQAMLDDGDTLYRLAVLAEPAAAIPWLRRAAAKNHVRSEVALAIALEEGRGTARDPAEAAQWYLKAAAAADPEAHYRLGNLYDRGVGLTIDTVKARDHYARAAALGHPAARERMARLLGENLTSPPAADSFKGLR
jgi:TPR repeat protein